RVTGDVARERRRDEVVALQRPPVLREDPADTRRVDRRVADGQRAAPRPELDLADVRAAVGERIAGADAVDDSAAAVARGVARIVDVLDALRMVRAVRIVRIAALADRAHVADRGDRPRRVVPALHAPG